jgi:hypothetical protein
MGANTLSAEIERTAGRIDLYPSIKTLTGKAFVFLPKALLLKISPAPERKASKKMLMFC